MALQEKKQSLISYIDNQYDLIKNDLENQIELERNMFCSLFPIDTLDQLRLEQYDKLNDKNTFANLIENGTTAFGSGSLGFNANKQFYQMKKDNEYHHIEMFNKDPEYIGLTNEQMFSKYMRTIKDGIQNINLDTYKAKDFLWGANILKIKILNIYRPDLRLTCFNTYSSYLPVADYFEIPYNDKDEDSITMNLKIANFIDSLKEEYNNYNMVVLYRLVLDYLKSIKVIDDKKDNYWFVFTNPKTFSFTPLNEDEDTIFFTKNENGNYSRIKSCFEKVKIGDPVICYESTPTQKIIAVGEISKENDGESIGIRKLKDLDEPIDKELFEKNDIFKDWKKQTRQATLVKLSKEQYNYIMDLINGDITIKTSSYSKQDFLKEVYIKDEEYDNFL